MGKRYFTQNEIKTSLEFMETLLNMEYPSCTVGHMLLDATNSEARETLKFIAEILKSDAMWIEAGLGCEKDEDIKLYALMALVNGLDSEGEDEE